LSEKTTATPPTENPGAPILLLRDPVIFPYSLTPAIIEGDINTEALATAMRRARLLHVFYETPNREEVRPLPENYELETFDFAGKPRSMNGVAVRVVKVLKFPDGSTRVLLRGIDRMRFKAVSYSGGVAFARTEPLPAEKANPVELEAAMKAAVRMFQDFAALQHGLSEELKVAVFNLNSPERLLDLLADNLNFAYPEKLLLLTLPDLANRYRLLTALLNRETETMQLGAKIQSEVHHSLSQSQREYYLREQLRTIQQELGEETRNPDIVEIERRMQEKNLPEKVGEVVRKELERLEIIPQAAPEYHVAYNYICWLLDVPWLECSEDRLDIGQAARVLDADHYGLKDVKERILEFLSVLQLKSDRKSPILCLVGPPGVGKTSLGQSIARALNRKFIRIALGGIRDEAEIRGHRRTYVGALPGRIIQGMKKAGAANPVFMLDEIDKLASDFRGDPASALLEVLDPEQNIAFNDHYLELDYDLSRVFFISTANLLDTIPAPLQDRMEIIQLPGYTSLEKREIARRYLAPRQIRENGLKSRQIRFNVSAINELIDHYTREAGVRQLERTIAQICRKLARRLVEGQLEPGKTTSVTPELVQELLGPRKFLTDEAETRPEVGCATGMAWTSCGGTILPVEVIAVPGKGDLKLTGSLGKVMQESAEAAFSFVRSQAARWRIDPVQFEKFNFHIHVPDGATPKDGPSAGITLGTALLSHLTGRPVKPRLAMTGEITLRGKVTAVGGIREKVIAALRAGIRTVIMPEENAKDTPELPDEVRSKMKFIFVSRFEEVAAAALVEPETGEKE
jgi:ATP-dependent Lon protease